MARKGEQVSLLEANIQYRKEEAARAAGARTLRARIDAAIDGALAGARRAPATGRKSRASEPGK